MTTRVFIIGTSHQLQTGHKSYTSVHHEQFRQILSDACSKFSVSEIVEELSQDVLKGYGVQHSIGWQVTVTEEIDHRYIDLTAKERGDLGLSRYDLHQIKEKSHLSSTQGELLEKYCGHLREYLWAIRILNSEKWPVLFVCGANHSDSVAKLLSAIGVDVMVLDKDFDPASE